MKTRVRWVFKKYYSTVLSVCGCGGLVPQNQILRGLRQEASSLVITP